MVFKTKSELPNHNKDFNATGMNGFGVSFIFLQITYVSESLPKSNFRRQELKITSIKDM